MKKILYFFIGWFLWVLFCNLFAFGLDYATHFEFYLLDFERGEEGRAILFIMSMIGVALGFPFSAIFGGK